MKPMELLGDVAQWNLILVYSMTVLVLEHDRFMVCAKCTIGLENCFGRTRWYSKLTRLKWKLVSDYFETVLILMHCAERTIGLIIILDAPNRTPR
jgi:hypothetical protein